MPIPLQPPPEKTPFVNANGTNNAVWLGWCRSVFQLLGGTIGAVPLERGGTGATDQTGAKAALGIPTAPKDIKAAPAGKDVNATGQVVSTHLSSALPIAQGGTGATTAGGARTSLGISSLTLLSGAGSPNGSVVASPGALYVNTSGGAGTTFYVKESGVGTNSGWVGK